MNRVSITMKLEYQAPPADLAEYFSAFYLFEADLDEMRDVERADVAQIRFVLDGSADVLFPGGQRRPMAEAALFGPRLCATEVIAKGPKMRLFGVGLLPAGWTRTVNKSAFAYTNQVIDAGDLLVQDMSRFVAELRGKVSLAQMAELTVERARPFFAAAPPAPSWFIRAVDDWLTASLAPNLADLEAQTGLSRRQIERLTKEHYGASPKLLMRKYRALRTANALANGKGEWHDFVDMAYYDQSHFIREVKEFTGMTPTAIREGRSPLAKLVFERERLAGLVSPLVSAT